MPNLKSNVLIICGTTGSGKTALALKLANDKPTSIISADSRQAYEDLSIITGKDIPAGFEKIESELIFHGRRVIYYCPSSKLEEGTREKYGGVRLWGFDLLKPDETFNAAEFVDLTNQIIKKEIDENRQVIIVGGTGFYLKALTEPQSLAQVEPDEKLRQKLNKMTTGELQQQLWEINPQKFLSLNDSDIKNPRRLIRAIEVSATPSPYQGEGRGEVKHKFTWLGLILPLEVLKQKIRERVISRLEAGAPDEVKNLLAKYPDQTLPIYTTLGVKHIVRLLQNEISKAELVDLWTIDEVNYAKRQITWFKKQSQIIWYT